MHSNKKFIFVFTLLFIAGNTFAQKPQTPLLKVIDSALQKAADQYKYMAKNIAPAVLPKNYNPLTKKSETSNSGWWCSGFYPGTLNYLYENSHDNELWDRSHESRKIVRERTV
jgi:unsaturated chondroitin disaccharide hydrolase